MVEDIALLDIRQIYNEMVPSSDLSDLFELVVDIAVDAFLGDAMRHPHGPMSEDGSPRSVDDSQP